MESNRKSAGSSERPQENMTVKQLSLSLLADYLQRFPEEEETLQPFVSLLNEADCFSSSRRLQHFTASALVLSPEQNHTLMVKHKKFGRWLQPGGHFEGNETPREGAMREGAEETGLKNLEGPKHILDLDIHTIPANLKMPAHKHFDIRFLFYASMQEELTISDESHNLEWVEIENMAQSESFLRMLRKAGLLEA